MVRTAARCADAPGLGCDQRRSAGSRRGLTDACQGRGFVGTLTSGRRASSSSGDACPWGRGGSAGPTPRRCAASTTGSRGRPLENATPATYLAKLHDQGRAPASAATAVAEACFRDRLAGEPSPPDEQTARSWPATAGRPATAAAGKRATVRGWEPRRGPRHLPTSDARPAEAASPSAARASAARPTPRPGTQPPRYDGGAPPPTNEPT